MKKGIIIASFGTTFDITRELCIESIEKTAKTKYEKFEVIRAFTSEKVRDILKKRDGLHIYNVLGALEKMKDSGIREVFIQPLHIIPGFEYEKIINHAESFKKENKDFKIVVGKPLLYEESDFLKVINGLKEEGILGEKPIVFMGHGSEHSSDSAYFKLEKLFVEMGYKNVFIGTVEGKKTLANIIPKLKQRGIKSVKMRPFMLVAGDHAVNDMASDDADSWNSKLKAAGIETEIVVKGLGELKSIQQLFLEHLSNVVE